MPIPHHRHPMDCRRLRRRHGLRTAGQTGLCGHGGLVAGDDTDCLFGEVAMPLSCSCGDSDDWAWTYQPPVRYTTFPILRRRKRCSCGDLIKPGEQVAMFECSRPPRSDIEERIYGEEVPIADKWLCERCSDLYFSFAELGYCVGPDENMLELVEEYADEH